MIISLHSFREVNMVLDEQWNKENERKRYKRKDEIVVVDPRHALCKHACIMHACAPVCKH